MGTEYERLLRLAADGDVEAARELVVAARRRGDAVRAAFGRTSRDGAGQLPAAFDRFEALYDRESAVRALALQEIATLDVPGSPKLAAVEHAMSDEIATVRAAAFEALEEACRPQARHAAPSLEPELVLPVLLRGLRDPESRVRDRAAAAFLLVDMAPLLMAPYESSGDEDGALRRLLRADPERWLGKHPGTIAEARPRTLTAREQLAEHIAEVVPRKVRARAFATALWRILDLLQMTIPRHPHRMALVVEGLWRLSPSAVLAWYRLPANTLHTEVRRILRGAPQPPTHFGERLADALLADPAPTAAFLARLGNPPLMPRVVEAQLVELTQHRDYVVRAAALRASVGVCGPEATRPALEVALHDSIAKVRLTALELLLDHDDEEVRLEALELAAGDHGNRVMLERVLRAIRAGVVAPSQAVGALRGILAAPDPRQRCAVLGLIYEQSIDPGPLRDELEACRHDVEAGNRELARRILERA